MVRVYPSDQNVSQLLPTPTVGPGTLTPTPAPTVTPTPTPTPTPGIPISTTNLSIYNDGQSISYPGTGSTWFNLATPIPFTPGFSDTLLIATPTFNQTPSKNYFSFDGLNEWAYSLVYGGVSQSYNGSYTWGGWYRLSRGPVNKPLLSFGVGLEYNDPEWWGCPLNLFKNQDDYIAVRLFLQQNPVPGQFTVLTGTTVTSTTKIPNDEWCYIVATYQENSQIKIYLNGNLIATGAAPASGFFIYTNPSVTNVGWNLGRGGELSYDINPVYSKLTRMDVGDIEVYYNAVLNATQILSNYNAQINKYI
jgi:hypothetical protein